MANSKEIVVKYTADIGQLATGSQKAVDVVEKTAQKSNKAVSTAAKKTQDTLAKTTAQGAEKTKSSFMAIGQAVSLLTPALGEAGGKMAMFTSSGIMGLAVMTESVKLLAEAWKATLIGAVAAAGAAFGYFMSTFMDGTDEIERQKRALYGLSAARKADMDALANYNKLTEDGEKKLRTARVAAELFGTVEEEIGAQIEVTKAKLVAATIALEDMTEGQKDAAEASSRLQDKIASLEEEQVRLQEAVMAGGDTIKGFGSESSAAKDALAEVEKQLESLRQKMKDGDAVTEQSRIRFESLTEQAKELKAALAALQFVGPPAPEPPKPEQDKGGDAGSGAGVIAEWQKGGVQWANDFEKTLKDVNKEIDSNAQATADWAQDWLGLQSPINAVKSTTMGTFQTIKGGLSAAIAQVAIFGGSFEQIMSGVFASVAQMFINLVFEMLVTWVSAKITEIITGNIAAYSSIPFVGLALGLAGAAAAIAAAKSMAGSEGGAAFAEGGLVTGPVLAWVGEGNEDEFIAPRSDFEKAMRGSGEGHGHDLYLDGRKVGESVMKVLPSQVKRRGIRGF